ncbi:MAG: hypothetical protein HYV28_03260 [Ignavibacteriales bacterium]|nr:hypothetical protein [Ignavibacteriales bacterium]
MNRFIALRSLLAASLLLSINTIYFSGCTGSKPQIKTPAPIVDSNTIPLLQYAYVTIGGEGFALATTGTDEQITIFKANPEQQGIAVTVSPSRTRIALGYYDKDKKETNLIVYFIPENKTYWAKRNKGKWNANTFWDGDTLVYVNFYESKNQGKNKPPQYANSYTELIDIEHDKQLKAFKPKSGAILEAYLQGKYLVYSDNNGFYLTDKQSTKVLKSIRDFTAANRKSVSFASDGKNLIYIEKAKNSAGKQSQQLLLADYDGSNDKIILTPDFAPGDVVWRPGGRDIACSINSFSYTGVRHFALFDIESKKTTFRSEESYGNIPSFSEIHFSPSGAHAFMLAAMPAKDDTLRYYILRNIITEKNIPLKDSIGSLTPASIGEFVSWDSEETVLFRITPESYMLYNLFEQKRIVVNNKLILCAWLKF